MSSFTNPSVTIAQLEKDLDKLKRPKATNAVPIPGSRSGRSSGSVPSSPAITSLSSSAGLRDELDSFSLRASGSPPSMQLESTTGKYPMSPSKRHSFTSSSMPTIPAVFLPAAAAAAIPVAPAPTTAPDAGEPTNDATAESAKKPRKPVPPEYENKVFEKRPVLSKAERRAKQEAQVAAKQEAKGGLPPAGPSKAKAPATAAAAATPSVASASPHASAMMDNSKSPGMTGRARSGSAPVVPVFALPPGQVSTPTVMKPLEVSSKRTKSAGQEVFLRQEVAAQQRSNMFAHLPSFRRVNIEDAQLGYTVDDVHPAMIRLGLKFASGAISGSIARCVAFVEAVQLVLEDFECDSEKPFGAEWNAHLGRVGIRFLINCRPMSVSMGSALKHFKSVAKSLDANGITSKPQCKEIMRQVLVDFLEARVVAAHSVIVGHVYNTLVDGDVILTYAHSNIVEALLAYDPTKSADAKVSKSHAKRPQFRVIVADSRPHLEGRQTVRRLVAAGIPCTYVYLNALSHVMPSVTKVLLGAAALMSNGAAVSRAGTAVVAMVAKSHCKPVVLCCESIKISEHVQFDAISENELCDPDVLLALPGGVESPLCEMSKTADSQLKLLNLNYDLTPSNYISMVVTEFGMAPPTSVPAILRECRDAQTINVVDFSKK